MGAPMERVRNHWWVTPAYAIGGVVFAIIVAFGGPGLSPPGPPALAVSRKQFL
jgi:hypothetical protein